MQKAYSLQPQEQQQLSQIEEERKTLLAQYGALTLDSQRIRKQLPQLEERSRALLRDAIARNGITQFNAARLDNGNLLVDLPDAPEAAIPATPVVLPPERPSRSNGPAERK